MFAANIFISFSFNSIKVIFTFKNYNLKKEL